MTYAMLSLCFLAAAVAFAAVATVATRRRPGRQLDPLALAAAAAGLVLLTAVFDNVMIALDLFHYAPSQLLGLSLGRAPIEDFAYPLAGVLLLPSIWVLLRRRAMRRGAATRPDEGSGS